MSALPKPVLRGHFKRKAMKMLFGAVTSAITCGALYRYLIAVPRQNAYNEFMKTYDSTQHYEELVKYGLLKSVKMVQENSK